MERIRTIQQMLDEKSFVSEEAQLPRWRRVLHFWLLVFKSFQKNRGPVRASSLAYTTILSLVPVLAVVVSISTGFLQHNQTNAVDFLMDYFVNTVAPQLDLIQSKEAGGGAESRQAVVQKIKDFINNLNSGTLGLTAGLALVFIAISVLSSVENTFNDIWGVTRGRPWSARIVQYWAAITLAPIFIVTAVGLTSTAQIASISSADGSGKADATQSAAAPPATGSATNKPSQISAGTGVGSAAADKPGFFKRLINFMVNAKNDPRWPVRLLARSIGTIIPFVVLSLFLTLFYRLMPATSVRWDAAGAGGLVGGCLLQLNNLFNVVYLSKVVSYSKIYGSLGAVPIFLLGLYFSWLIILFGAQVGYAFQNRKAYVQEKQAESINQRGREFVAMRLMTRVAQSFFRGERPPTRLQMCQSLAVPSQLASQILSALTSAKLLVEVTGREEAGYSPARPIEKITIEDVLHALRAGLGSELATAEDPARAVLREEYERVVLAEMHAAGSVTLQNIVVKTASLPEPRGAEPQPGGPAAA